MNQVPNNKQMMAEHRRKLVDWVKSQLSASELKDGQEVSFSPLERYVSAVLFPVDRQGVGIDPAGEQDVPSNQVQAVTDDNEPQDDGVEPVKRRRYVPPSSVGFSFYVANQHWQIQLMATAKRFMVVGNRDEQGKYKKITYKVDELKLPNESLIVTQVGEYPIFERYGVSSNDKMDFLAKFDVRAVPYGKGFIVTATLINNQELMADLKNTLDAKQIKREQTEKTLFAVEFACVIDEGNIGDYPRVDYHLLSDDEQEIELQYNHKKVYAVGHGAAVHWELENGDVKKIMSDFMPIQEVPQVTADLNDERLNNVLSMLFLAQAETNTQAVCAELSRFVSLYGDWIKGQVVNLIHADPKHKQAGERLLARMNTAYERMQVGVWRIANDRQVAKAFAHTNRAMADQMKHPSKSWRAFQLAFILTTLNSVTDENDDFRHTVDLIWFPTGGGKTEAYLGLTAYQILYRRLKYPSAGGGTTVLMRYTLKLLTTQQFLRACRLICALELIRQRTGEFGREPITIGLWVGESASPNTVVRANELFIKAKTKGDFSAFVLDKCPCCDTPFNHHNFVVDAVRGKFDFVCRQPSCVYHDRALPCQVVDEVLYKAPPTLLLATVDKLAMLAWEERSSAFFGKDGNRPPELIIQDELHLIANALGSVAGIYESALQTVLASRYVKPKYIASTATIKEAQNQVQKLFAKELAIFPPQGLSCEDSFFAKTVDLSVRAGRLYVGYFAPLLNRQKNLAPLAGLLSIAPFVLFGHNQDEYEIWADAWWTQLVYHGSLRGVGNSHTAFEGAVRERFKGYVQEFFECNISHNDPNYWQKITEFLQNNHFDLSFYHQFLSQKIDGRIRPTIKQLTSNSTASENARIFSQLDNTCHGNNAVDVVLATNMVATGLDVGRLALMIINGQPITTSEYIQASSRVGRSDIAGVVFVNYYREQARSLSHYESFYPYHQSFYRYVEPTSVTPYTYQARRRALHSALVIALRHSIPKLLDNGGANLLDLTDESICRVVDIFKSYCSKADKGRAEATQLHIDNLLQEWQDYIAIQRGFRQKTYYYNKDKGTASLLRHYDGHNHGLWATLTNMRTVENSGVLKLL